MIVDPKRLQDGQLEFSRGVDTGRSPSRIDRNQLADLVNATCRDDAISTRPGFNQLALSFADNTLKSAFETGLFQRAYGYQPRWGDAPHLVLSITGRLFRVNVATDFSVQEIPFTGSNNPTLNRAWFEQAEEYLFWQDNQDIPLIYDGATCVRSDILGTHGFTTDIPPVPLKELPVGNVMRYCNGRLTVALPDGRSFTIGDLVGGPTGVGSDGNRAAVFHFTENQFLNEVEGFSVPAGKGKITAMATPANLDTSLGQGPLQVFTTDAAFSMNLPTDRTTWLNVTYPIQSVSVMKNGAISAEAAVLVNGDIWMRSRDGARSFIIARRDFGMWSNTPMSHEVTKYLDKDDPHLMQFCSAALFDNRLLVTVSPKQYAGNGIAFRGLVVLDFTPITAIGKREQPAWDGLWTGLNTLQLVPLEINGVDHLYAVTFDDGKIGIWEFTTKQRYDQLADGSHRRITMAFETPRYDFGNRLERKLLEGFDAWLSNLGGVVDGTVFHRPDQDQCWHLWQTWQKCSPLETCPDEAVEGCQVNLNKQPQFSPRLSLQRPPDVCETGMNLFPTRLGYEHQARWEITGSCRIESLRAFSYQVVEETYGPTPELIAACEPVICCEPVEEDLPLPVP